MEANSLPNTLAGLAVSITLAVAGTVGALTFFGHGYALPEGVRTLRAVVQEARTRATTTGNGATLAFSRDATTHAYAATIYDGRPNGEAFDGPIRSIPFDRSISIVVNGEATSALFISSSGTVSTAAWTDGETLATEPTCPGGAGGSFTIAVTADSKTENLAMSCADARIP